MNDFPGDLIRVEALLNERTPAHEFLDQIYFPKFIKAGVPKSKIMESGIQETSFGPMAYMHVRMVENGWSIQGDVRTDGIRTLIAVNIGETLLIVSRQRDEYGFDGAFNEDKLETTDQLAELIAIAETINVHAK